MAIFTIIPRPQVVSFRSPKPPPIRHVCHAPVNTAIGAAYVEVRDNRATTSERPRPATKVVTKPPIHSATAPR